MGSAPKPRRNIDDFLRNYDASEIRIAAEFLSNWLPYLSRGLCQSCTRKLSNGIRSLHTGDNSAVYALEDMDGNEDRYNQDNCSLHSAGSTKDSAEADTYSLGSWKDEADYTPEHAVEAPLMNTAFTSTPLPANSAVKKSWADIAMEDELVPEEGNDVSTYVKDSSAQQMSEVGESKPKVPLSRAEREHIRFSSVVRKKEFVCEEKVGGKWVNILEGLELHKGVFSAAEQKRIVNFVEELEEKGRNGLLKERTYSAPVKWMRGKGRITLQFGCCYNYATDRKGNPPGILKNELVDPLPDLFKTMIKRLVRWHVLPASCVPDSCIVNIYEEGDCIPPHIDNHDFVRPFCTVSFLCECNILFGSNLKIVGPGDFAGSYSISLPVGSVLVLKGNGADVAKHCVPAVPARRISITFRRMDDPKRPIGFTPEPDLLGLEPLWEEEPDKSKNSNNLEKSQKFDSVDRSGMKSSSADRSATKSEEGDEGWRSRPRRGGGFRKLAARRDGQGRVWVERNPDDGRRYSLGRDRRRVQHN